MSWLYSIVFAGLLFSSHTDQAANPIDHFSEPAEAVTKAVKDETEKFEQTYPLNASGRVSVSNINGSIIVEAWDRNEVRLEATKIADSRESLDGVEIKVDSRPDHLSVETDYKGWKMSDRGDANRGRRIEVQFRLSVPRTAILDDIETVNGSVTVSNFSNVTKISAVNGNVTATNLRGAANLSTVNGEVSADFDRLETGSRISLSTVNGRVNLVIPSDANATIRADSLNGEITNSFGLPVRKGQYIGRDLYGRVGTGDIHIKLNSVNGGLSIGRKADGKNPNPATNLLPEKRSDDEGWDGNAGVAHIDRDIARAVRQSNRESVRAAREAEKVIAKVKPELAKIKVAELAKLEGLNEKLLEAQIEAQVESSLARQKEALSSLVNVNWAAGAPTIEKKRNSFAVKGTPTVTVETKGCGVRIRGWDKSEVQYVVTEIAGRGDRDDISITENQKDSEVNLKVSNPNEDLPSAGFRNSLDRVRVEVFVPRKSNLKIISDGEIRLEGVTGEIDLNGSDAAINIRDSGGKLQLAAEDGQVRVIGFHGEFDSTTADGDVYLEGSFDKLSARSADGTITLTLPSGTNASFLSNTEIETEGLEVLRENDGTWRLGRGGPKFNFDFADGRLVLRSAAIINTY